MRGSFAGAYPMNEAIRLSPYPPRSGFCAVPVLPATAYPGTAARAPDPLTTTDWSIVESWRALRSDMTCLIRVGPIFRTEAPDSSMTSRTNIGCMSVPPFATAHRAFRSCRGVTEIPCPNPLVASSTGPILDALCIMPTASPGKSMPVLSARPNART